MKKIWKYELETVDEQMIPMPGGAKLLCVDTQHEQPCLWALVNPENPKLDVCINTIGTGNLIRNNPGNYLGSYQLSGGALVFHVFEG